MFPLALHYGIAVFYRHIGNIQGLPYGKIQGIKLKSSNINGSSEIDEIPKAAGCNLSLHVHLYSPCITLLSISHY